MIGVMPPSLTSGDAVQCWLLLESEPLELPAPELLELESLDRPEESLAELLSAYSLCWR
jgi:hypothetical protein